ncbi:hypothetical protein FCOIX_7850 [Fusarium coicis]|nr:hypothetical protein FCOIX_7850 [Fusarium coicis]
MFPPTKNGGDKPFFADWMAGVQSLLPAVDFDHPNDSAEPNRHPDISAIDFAADDFNFATDLTDDVFSNRLPLLCDDTFDDFFSFDPHDAKNTAAAAAAGHTGSQVLGPRVQRAVVYDAEQPEAAPEGEIQPAALLSV